MRRLMIRQGERCHMTRRTADTVTQGSGVGLDRVAETGKWLGLHHGGRRVPETFL